MARYEGDEEPGFEESMRAGFEAMARERGACLDEATLERLATGLLPAAEAEGARRHIARCGLCDLRSINVANLAVTESKLADGARERVRPTTAVVQGAATQPAKPRGIWGLIWNPAFAYAVALAALIVPVAMRDSSRGQAKPTQTTRQEQPPSVGATAETGKPPAARPVVFVSLDRVRGAGAGVPLVSGSQDFALGFWVKETAGHEYEAMIRAHGAAKPLVIAKLGTSDGMGNFRLACDRSRFARGDYELIVRDVGASATAEPLHVYRFRVE